MPYKFIPNIAIFVGQIVDIFSLGKSTIITLNTGYENEGETENFPHIYCYGPTKTIVDKYYQVGDLVKLNCSVQNNENPNDTTSYQNVVLFKIDPITSDEVTPKNKFTFLGKIFKIRQNESTGHITALTYLYTKRKNVFPIWFEPKDEKQLKEFLEIKPTDTVRFSGYIKTGEKISKGALKRYEVCSVTDFRVIPPKEKKLKQATAKERAEEQHS